MPFKVSQPVQVFKYADSGPLVGPLAALITAVNNENSVNVLVFPPDADPFRLASIPHGLDEQGRAGAAWFLP